MLNKKTKAVVMVLLVGVLVFTAGCVNTTSSAGVQQKAPEKIAGSIEQDNINKRLQIVNSPTSTMWFYGLSETGTVIFRSVVNGKVTSSTKRLEPILAEPTTCASKGANGWDCSNEMLQADGTFGTSDEYVFWFDMQGNYYQWNGKYILTTTPLKIPTPIIEFQTESA